MKVTLDVTGKELALLYICYGNESAKRVIDQAIQTEKEFNQLRKAKENESILRNEVRRNSKRSRVKVWERG